ncbi:MAG: hypothetical protein NTV99_03640 [Deltaproteobacteria bacterium]|nr:hypothetical protein [Deltaproteobacteria bacterium]
MSMFLVLFIINIHNSAIRETLIFNFGIPEVVKDGGERAVAKITICNPYTRQLIEGIEFDKIKNLKLENQRREGGIWRASR